MSKSALRWICVLTAVLAAGPLVASLVAQLPGPSGSSDSSFLWSAAPVRGLALLLLVAAATGVGAVLSAKLAGFTFGLGAGAVITAWSAFRTGGVADMVRENAGGSPVTFVIEGAVFAVLGVAIVMATWAQARPRADREKQPSFRQALRNLRKPPGLAAIVAALAAAIVASFLVAFEGLRGQAIFAAWAAGIAGGAAGGLAAGALGAERTPVFAPFVGVLLAAVVGPIIAMIVPGSGAFEEAALRGTLSGPAVLQPVDWLFGALLGVPTGVGWVAASLEQTAYAPESA
ncbi:MAG: hypothetical protein AAFR38_07730 [Planctomycetota bacterium]